MPNLTTLPQPPKIKAAAASSRERWQVVIAVVTVAFLTILARVGISGAKVEMSRDLGISDLRFGWVFGAFALGYAVFMLPSGLVADRWGPRRALALSVFFWSFFTLCTGLVSGITVLIGIRFWFGLAEAGVFPQAARALQNWTLPQERGLALGLLNTGSRLGAAFGLAVTPFCVARLGWRASFVWLGILGAVWAVVWFGWFRDAPAIRLDARRSNTAPATASEAHGATSNKIPWGALLSSRNFFLILYQYFACNFAFFLCFSWLLPLLKTRYAISTTRAGLYSSIPLYVGAIATWSGGVAVDWIYKRGRFKLSRAGPAMFGFGLAITMMVAAPFMPFPGWFIACFALMTFGLDLTVSSSWTVCCDVGGEYSGTLSAAMNTMGAMGSFASSLLFPLLIGRAGDVKTYFYLASLLNLIALACWKFIEPAKTCSTRRG